MNSNYALKLKITRMASLFIYNEGHLKAKLCIIPKSLRFLHVQSVDLNHKVMNSTCSAGASSKNLDKSNFKSTIKFSCESLQRKFVNQSRNYSSQILKKSYNDAKTLLFSKKVPEDIGPSVVFASNELNLEEIKVYGFDYDYTVAQYEASVEFLIYELGKQALISQFKYPKGIEELKYDRNFAVRGLHYDITNGLLMKLDQFQQIQIGSIYRGFEEVSLDEIRKIYGSRALSLGYVEGNIKGSTKMAHLADLFSIPEMCLLRQVTHFFRINNYPYHSVSIFNDVKSAIGSIHPEMHRIVGENIPKYLIKDPNLVDFFNRLKKERKETFMITNSPYEFVDLGMRYLLGDDWHSYFDVVIAKAKKPYFFTDSVRPFRELSKDPLVTCWGPVHSLEKGKVYLEGNLFSLQNMKKWYGPEVLYFGDHPYSDLADVSLHHLWRTGAIIWELDNELEILNSNEYKVMIGWLQILQGLIESGQSSESNEAKEVLQEWMIERDELRQKTKEVFNKEFGSVFRTHDNPTYFSRRLFRFADIYTSRLTNLINYSTTHTFYPRKGVLPHEYKSLFV